MRRVLILLDVTEAEAEPIIQTLEAAAGQTGLEGLREAYEGTRAEAPSGTRGIILQRRSMQSFALGGPFAGVGYEKAVES
jgi:hypothetical protein